MADATRQGGAPITRGAGNERERLLAAAREAAQHAYAPYSRFRVGAAVLVETTAGPRVITGANVENASYGLTLCAERAALAAACMAAAPDASGAPAHQPPRITHVAVACVDAPTEAPLGERMPCGACRQWLAELAPDAIYYVDGVYVDGVERALRLDDLLPMAFRLTK